MIAGIRGTMLSVSPRYYFRWNKELAVCTAYNYLYFIFFI